MKRTRIKIISLETLLAQTERRLKETQGKLLAIDEEHVHLRMGFTTLEKENKDRNEVISRLQGKKKDLEERVQHLEAQLKTTQDNCGTLKEEKTQLVKQLNDLERITLAELRRNLTRMQGERDRALEDLKAVKCECRRSRESIGRSPGEKERSGKGKRRFRS